MISNFPFDCAMLFVIIPSISFSFLLKYNILFYHCKLSLRLFSNAHCGIVYQRVCILVNNNNNNKNMLQVYSVPQRYFSSSRDSLQGAYVNRGASEFDLSRKPKRRDQLRGRFKLPYTVALTSSRDQSHLHTPASVNHLSNSSCNGTET